MPDVQGCWDQFKNGAALFGDKARKFAPLAVQAGIIGIDGLFFLGKVCRAIPDKVTAGALVALSSIGVIGTPYSLDLAWKLIHDVFCGVRSKNHLVTLLASVKALVTLTNLGLILGGMSASCQGLAGNKEREGEIYQNMVPVGEATLVLTILLQIGYLFATRRAIALLQEEQSSAPAELLRAMDSDRNSGCDETAQKAALLRACMDKDTLRQLVHDSREILESAPEGNEQVCALLAVVAKNLDTELKYQQAGGLGLIAAGYGAMALEKLFTPDSAAAAFINLTMALANGKVMYDETAREVEARNDLSDIAAVRERFRGLIVFSDEEDLEANGLASVNADNEPT